MQSRSTLASAAHRIRAVDFTGPAPQGMVRGMAHRSGAHGLVLFLGCSALMAQAERAPILPAVPATEAACGYAAQVAATAVFVSGRTLEAVRREELAPATPLQALVTANLALELDEARRCITARIGAASATAAWIEGMGCTRLDLRAEETLDAALARVRKRARALPLPEEARPWPGGEGPPEVPPAPNSTLDAALARAFEPPRERGGPITRAVVVVHAGRIVAERHAVGLGPHTALPGWSMTKTWVDALLGIRVRQGRLDPDAPLPVAAWTATRADGTEDPRRALRLDHLLRMESGLRWDEDHTNPASAAVQMLFRAHDAAAVAAALQPAHPPGVQWNYSSASTNLLCGILRTTFADDASHARFAREELFGPLGMTTASLATDAAGTFVGSSFGNASARDWARFGLFYLQDGVWEGQRLLPEGWVAASRTPARSAPRGGFGRHLWLNAGTPGRTDARRYPELPPDLFHLSGFQGQHVLCFPTERVVLVRMGTDVAADFDIERLAVSVLRALAHGPR